MSQTMYEEAREAILCGAEKVRFPHIEELRSRLATEMPAEQFAALLDSVRQLARHTGKEPLITQSTIFRLSINPEASVERQKACVRSVAKEVPALVAMMTKEDEKAAGGEAGEGSARDAGGEGAAGRKEGEPDEGGKPPVRLSEQQELLVKFAPKLRFRLRKANLAVACQALDPPVDIRNRRYPIDEAAAMELLRQMSEKEFSDMFADLQRAATHFLACPQLADAKRFNQSLADVRRRKQNGAFLGHCSAPTRDVIERLLMIQNDHRRMKTLMDDDAITQPLVAEGLRAYSRLVAENLGRAAGQPVPSIPPSDAPEVEKPAAEGGRDPKLPLMGPAKSGSPDRPGSRPAKPVRPPQQASDSTQGERLMAERKSDLDKALGDDHGHRGPTRPASDVVAVKVLQEELVAVRKDREDAERRGQAALEKSEKEKEELRKERDNLKEELVVAKRPAAVVESPEVLRLREENVRLRQQPPASSNSWTTALAVVGVVGLALVIVLAIAGLGSGFIPTAWTTQDQPVQQQSEPAASVPTTFDFSDL